MPDVVRSRSVPQIIISDTDYDRLSDLANASLQRLPEVAQELLDELDRAQIVSDEAVPADVVRMGSTVTFKSDDGQTRTMTLVYPVDESLDAHRISVMTPIVRTPHALPPAPHAPLPVVTGPTPARCVTRLAN